MKSGLRNVLLVALAFVALQIVGAAVATTPADCEPTYSMQEIMKKGHKGDGSLLKKVLSGAASDDEKATLKAYYAALADHEPPNNPGDAWKQKVQTLRDALDAFLADAPDAAQTLEQAANCKACHNAHK